MPQSSYLYSATLLAMFNTCIYAAETPTPTFFSKDSAVAARELKVIDWALSYAAQKYTIDTVKQKIAQEWYVYKHEDDRDYGMCSSPVEEINCLLHINEKITAGREYDYTLLRQLLMKDCKTLLERPQEYATCDDKGVTKMQTASILVAMAPENCYIQGLKPDEPLFEYYPTPTIFVQVLIEKHKNEAQNKINKEYLLTRLRAVYEHDSKM
jgi:hypothetical protein